MLRQYFKRFAAGPRCDQSLWGRLVSCMFDHMRGQLCMTSEHAVTHLTLHAYIRINTTSLLANRANVQRSTTIGPESGLHAAPFEDDLQELGGDSTYRRDVGTLQGERMS